jgi:hypothetical protein
VPSFPFDWWIVLIITLVTTVLWLYPMYYVGTKSAKPSR